MAKRRKLSSNPKGDITHEVDASEPKERKIEIKVNEVSRPTGKWTTPASQTQLNQTIPAEVTRGDWTVLIFGAMIFFAPTLGVPNEEMLQDTLKSIVVAFATLFAAVLFFWRQRNRRDALRWHAVMYLPLSLMIYALISMAWSHTFLAGVEAIRWFIFSVILWLGINTFSRDKIPHLFWGIHLGASGASLWALLQFWIDFTYFPQGPNPASTFVNRNFFAEYVVCTIPFSIYLLANARRLPTIALLAFTVGFNIVGMMSTGTRSALTAFWILLLILPIILFIYRRQFSFNQWNAEKRIIGIGTLIATIVGLGLIGTANPRIIGEHASEQRGLNALQRGFARTASMTQKEEYTERSFSVRLIMWKATMRIIQQRPFSGVGAGAWEVDIPLYQAAGSQLETDYYVHNEILQLLAEYGLVGWIFLILLIGYLLLSTWKTLRARTSTQLEAPIRAIALAGLLAFLVISNAGFPWRLASTGVIFALGLALLAASDSRLGNPSPFGASRLRWSPVASQVLAIFTIVSLALTAFISQQAAECEFKIVRATKLALTITASGDFNNPKWDKSKAEMLKLIKEGTDINPHYRKITPMVADELAKWGDWKNATWVWETVISSRPYVVAIMANVARGYATLGNIDKALGYLERAKAIQPKAPSVRSLEVVLLSRSGKEAKALALAKDAIAMGAYDFDLVNAAFILAWRASEYPFALQVMDIRLKGWPANRVPSLLQLGNMYTTGMRDQIKGLETFKAAMDATPPEQRQSLLPQIPPVYWPKLGFGHITPVMPNQTSSTKK